MSYCTPMDNARLYSEANALQRTDARKVLQEVISALPLKKGARVLDVGCGSGDVTAEVLLPLLPTDVEEVVGVDVSESMVAHAREVHGCPRLIFVQLDIEVETSNVFQKLTRRLHANNNNIITTGDETASTIKGKMQQVDILLNGLKIDEEEEECRIDTLKKIPEQVCHKEINKCAEDLFQFSSDEKRFDVIFSFYCLHWIQNQRQAFKNMYSMLKYGGETVFILLANSTIFTLYERLAEMPQWSQYMLDVRKFISPYNNVEDPAGELADEAVASGFHVLSVECRARSFKYKDYHAIRNAIKAVNPFYARLPTEQRSSFLDDCLATVKTHNLAKEVDSGLVVNYTLLVAHLRK